VDVVLIVGVSDLVERRRDEPARCENRPPEDVAVEAVLRLVVVGDVEAGLMAADTAQ